MNPDSYTKNYPENYPTEPTHLWSHFFNISRIPRPSAKEQAFRDWIIALASEHQADYKVDQAGNLVIYVPGSTGRETEGPVVIQNHLDMVTVKRDDIEHDFEQDALELKTNDGWLTANGTTLGADNGLGCAAALALMTDPTISHPPLELLFTVEEETGLFGAQKMDASLLSGKTMLNLDTEDWTELFIGCAGGRGWFFYRELETVKAPSDQAGFSLSLQGLSGGHSGMQIHQQLGNANKLIAEWLLAAQPLGVQLGNWKGGVAHNVIPRSCQIQFSCQTDKLPELQRLNEQLITRWQSYLPQPDQQLTLELTSASVEQVLTAPSQKLMINLLMTYPHGALSYHPADPAELVELSSNLAVVELEEGQLSLETSLRFFNDLQAQGLIDTVMAIADQFRLTPKEILNYPGWQPDLDSPLLARGIETYQQLFGARPEIKAIHAGLECGILKSKKPELDILSFGPTIRGAHSPSERLQIDTVEPFWQLLTQLLAKPL
jgi:dipeptidase D